MAHYQQLSEQERYQIRAFLQAQRNHSQIANLLGRSQSTISREIKRNSKELSSYLAEKAQKLAASRRHRKRPLRRKPWEEIMYKVYELLKLRFTPERIATESVYYLGMSVSTEWLYRRIRETSDWYKYLPRAKKKRQKRRYGKACKISGRTSIHDRPDIVEKKERFGDWEVDTVIGKGGQSGVVTAVERKSNFYCCRHIANKQAETVSKTLISMLKVYAEKGLVHTLTFDNGTEFARHDKVAEELKCKTFFADPYASYQRGCNEHHNGLLRRFYPKKTDFSKVPEKQLQLAISIINIWPRKHLEWKRPAEYFPIISTGSG